MNRYNSPIDGWERSRGEKWQRSDLEGVSAHAPFLAFTLSPLRRISSLIISAMLSLGSLVAHAVISEPDNIIYGSITLNNVPISAARTDVVIEARRTTNGPAIATYRMGNNPALGDFYALTLRLESAAPSDSSVSVVGDTVFVTVLENGVPRGQTGFVIAERGVAQRIDFGAAVMDGDGDGLPDTWELLHFAGLSRGPNSPAANGQTIFENYFAGANPNDPSDGFRLLLTTSNNVKRVSFEARAAEGVGYNGMIRRYTLETKSGLAAAAWVAVSGVVNLPGTNQTVVYETTSGGSAFYRGRISLDLATIEDQDNDTLPDNWELQFFGNLSTNASSINLNGQTARQNYVAGTNPNLSDSAFRLSPSLDGSNRRVEFQALATSGPGYDGRQRFYAVEWSPSPIGPWQEVGGLSGVLAANQTVIHQSPATGDPIYFRARVWLQP